MLGNSTAQLHWNIHNHGLSPDDKTKVITLLSNDVAWTRLSPLADFLFLLGDFNARNSQTVLFPYLNSSQAVNGEADSPQIASTLFLQDLGDELLEFIQPFPAHFWPPSKQGTIIDRAVTSVPTFLVPVALWNINMLDDPMALHLRDLSDQAPLVMELQTRRGLPRHSRPISRDVFFIHNFLYFISNFLTVSGLSTCRLTNDFMNTKRVIKRVAELTRQFIQDTESETVAGRVQLLTTITWAFWSNDTSLARRLVTRISLGKEHLNIVNGQVSLSSPLNFNDLVVQVRQDHVASQSQLIPTSAKKTNKAQQLARLAELWIPPKKMLIISGIKSNGTVYRGDSKRDVLTKAWAPTFAFRPANEEAARDTFRWATPLMPQPPESLTLARPPNRDTISEYLSRQRDSGVGPDGLPYSAWTATRSEGIETLYGVSSEINQIEDVEEEDYTF